MIFSPECYLVDVPRNVDRVHEMHFVFLKLFTETLATDRHTGSDSILVGVQVVGPCSTVFHKAEARAIGGNLLPIVEELVFLLVKFYSVATLHIILALFTIYDTLLSFQFFFLLCLEFIKRRFVSSQ